MSLAAERARSSPEPSARRRGALLAVTGGLALLAVLFVLGLVMIPRFQAAHPPTPLQRSDADRSGFDDLHLDLTLVTTDFLRSRKLERYLGGRDPASVLPVLVGLNTHTGSVEHMHHLPDTMVLVGPDGRSYPSLSEPIVLSQHHNTYLVLFPSHSHRGRSFLEQTEGVLAVEARGLGRQPLRRFEWELPLPDTGRTLEARSWAVRLSLALALLSALLVVLSPCALELSLYYSAIISCTVTEGEREAASRRSFGEDPGRVGRRRVITNLLAFVGGFTLLYAASGATVGWIGEGVRQPLGPYGELFQVLGGLLIVGFALRVAGAYRFLGARLPSSWRRARQGAAASSTDVVSLPSRRQASTRQHAGRRVGRWFERLRRKGQGRLREGYGMRARDSFMVGLGLSSACLTCMGGAVLYPLLVYAGITSWYSGLTTLTLYSLGMAIPMLLIALGFVDLRLTLRRRLGLTRTLRYSSAVLLLAIGLVILLGYERVITDTTFRFLAGVSRWV